MLTTRPDNFGADNDKTDGGRGNGTISAGHDMVEGRTGLEIGLLAILFNSNLLSWSLSLEIASEGG